MHTNLQTTRIPCIFRLFSLQIGNAVDWSCLSTVYSKSHLCMSLNACFMDVCPPPQPPPKILASDKDIGSENTPFIYTHPAHHHQKGCHEAPSRKGGGCEGSKEHGNPLDLFMEVDIQSTNVYWKIIGGAVGFPINEFLKTWPRASTRPYATLAMAWAQPTAAWSGAHCRGYFFFFFYLLTPSNLTKKIMG